MGSVGLELEVSEFELQTYKLIIDGLSIYK